MHSTFLLDGISSMTMLTHYIRGAPAINDLSTIYIDKIRNVTHSLLGGQQFSVVEYLILLQYTYA